MASDTARMIVGYILGDLCDRGGLSGAWDQIDEDIQRDIRATWEARVDGVLRDGAGVRVVVAHLDDDVDEVIHRSGFVVVEDEV